MTRLSAFAFFLTVMMLGQAMSALELRALPGSQGTLFLESFQGPSQGLQGIQVAMAQGLAVAETAGSEDQILSLMDRVCNDPNLSLEFRCTPTPLNRALVQRLLQSSKLCGMSREKIRFETLEAGQNPEDAEGLVQLSIVPRVDTRTTAAWEAYR